MSAVNDYITTLEKREEIIKELRRLEAWWRNDAAYRPPEDRLQAYALGNADAYARMLKMELDMFPQEEEEDAEG